MNIFSSTCGRLNSNPCVPSILKSALIKNAVCQYYSFDLGKLLFQEKQLQGLSVYIFHFFSQLEDDYNFNIDFNQVYLLLNFTNTFQASWDENNIQLYEHGFCFLKSTKGKITWKAKSSHEYKFVLIALSPELVDQLTQEQSTFPQNIICFPQSEKIYLSQWVMPPKTVKTYFDFEKKEEGNHQSKLMLEVVRSCIQQMEIKPFPHANKLKEKEIESIYLFKHILQSQLQKDVDIVLISQQLGMNERRLRTGFRRVYGVSIFEYILFLRMENANNLIIYSTIKINKIANLVGYQSKFTFAAAFRKYFNNRPSFNRRIKTNV